MIQSPPMRCESRALVCAPTTAPLDSTMARRMPSWKKPAGDVGRAARESGDRQDEERRRRGDMDREAKQIDQRGHLEKAAADAEGVGGRPRSRCKAGGIQRPVRRKAS